MTVVVFNLVVQWANGSLLGDHFDYKTDQSLYNIYLILAIPLTLKLWGDVPNRKLWTGVGLTFLYYFTAFAMFSDGNAGVWSHSPDSMGEKIFRCIFLSFILLFSVFIPAIFFAIALIQNILIKFTYYVSNNA